MSRLLARFDVTYPSFRLQAELALPSNGISAVFGQSGSGKTTLLRCLAGLERSSNGFMSLDGEVWQDESRGFYLPMFTRPIGYVFQEPRLFPHLTVRSNLAYGLKRIPAGSRRVVFEQVVEILGIEHLLERHPQKLSGGEQQRVAIGRALLTSPRLLLLDEPLSSLDAHRKREILPFILRLHRELAIPIVYVSHSISEILQLAQVVALIDGGRIVATGPITEVFSRPDLHRSLGPRLIGAILDTIVEAHEPEFGLTRLAVKGQSLFVPQVDRRIGALLRVHILSSDVTLTREEFPVATSALNTLKAVVVEFREVDRTSTDVLLDIGYPLVASITRKSLSALGLQVGQRVYAHVKSVALTEDCVE